MTEPTSSTSHAEAAARAAEAYLGALPVEPHLVRIDHIDRLGVPTVAAHLTLGERIVGTFGYGTTEDEARASALGELVEWSAHALAVGRRRLERGSRRELRARGLDAVDPLTLTLDPGTVVDDDTPLAWTSAERMTDGAPRWVPVELVACNPGELPPGVTPMITPITNGLGAGDTRARAQVHALLELIQRDGNSLRYRALDTGAAIDIDACDDPDVVALVASFRDAGVEPIVKLAATDLGTLNVWASADDHQPDPSMPLAVTAGGEAADPDPVRAVRKALSELAAARSRKSLAHGRFDVVARIVDAAYLDDWLSRIDPGREEPRALQEMARWAAMPAAELAEEVAVIRHREHLIGWDDVTGAVGDPPAGDPAARLAHVVAALERAGLEALWAQAETSEPGVVAGKAIVAGLEVETMSYGRVGPRGLAVAAERGLDLCGVGSGPPGALAVPLDAEARARVGGPAWIAPDRIAATVGPLYPLYREPSRHAVLSVLGGHDGSAAETHRHRSDGCSSRAGGG